MKMINLLDAEKKVSDFIMNNPELAQDDIIVNLQTGQCFSEENAPDEAFDIVQNKASYGWSWGHLLSRKLDY